MLLQRCDGSVEVVPAAHVQQRAAVLRRHAQRPLAVRGEAAPVTVGEVHAVPRVVVGVVARAAAGDAIAAVGGPCPHARLIKDYLMMIYLEVSI